MKQLLLAILLLTLVQDIAGAAPPRATRRELVAIRERARSTPGGTIRLYEPKIEVLGAEVDLEAMRDEAQVARRLGGEFGIGAGQLFRERARVASRWSDFMIAHTVFVNTPRPISFEQVLGLRRGGLPWTSIAYGLGLRPIQLVSAVRSESRVATGLDRPDGRVHVIATLERSTFLAEHRR